MSTTPRFGLAVLSVVAVACVDAVLGRVLHAHVGPTWLGLLAAGFVAAQIVFGPASAASVLRSQKRLVLGVVAGVLFLASFQGAATRLVGWNDSLPWSASSRELALSAVLAGVGALIPAEWLRGPAAKRGA